MNRHCLSIKNLLAALLLCLITGNISAQTVIIGAGSQNGTSSNGATGDPGPIYKSSATSSFIYSRYHYLYTTAELATAGLPSGSLITGIAWNLDNGAGMNTNFQMEIWLENSGLSVVQTPPQTWAAVTATATQVYNSTSTFFGPTTGWLQFNTTPFVYTGGALELSVASDMSQGTSPWTTAGFSWKKDPINDRTISYCGSAPSTTLGNARTVRPQLRITYVPGTPCSGAPTAGTASASVTGACPSTPFSLSLTGYTSASGITFQWQSRVGTSGPWTNIAGATSAGYSVMNQTAASQYRAYVTCTSSNLSDTSTIVTVSQNTPAQCICFPTYANGGTGDNITNVQLGTLVNNTTAASNPSPYYVDYTSQQPSPIAIPSLTEGSSYNLSVSFGTDPNQYNGVWVDFNQDGIFSTTEFFTSNSNAGANGTAVISITVPAGAVGGNTRMRIRGGDDSQPSSNQACGASNSTWGEAEDYLVNIVPLCTMPSGLNAAGITGTSANLSWNAVTGSAGYQYVVNTNSTPPASGTAQSGTTHNATGLIPGTTYYLHVRNSCGSSWSMWATYSFVTACNAPSGVAASGVSASGATFNWNAVPSVVGYEYAITTAATPPASGTAVATNSYTSNTLIPSTAYYFHVRTQCNATTFSPWTTIPFSTQAPSCFSPASVTISNLTPTSATINWTAVTSATDYEYAVTTTATPPASGTATTALTAPSGPLTPGTTYYAHVRNICSPTLTSIWKTTSFVAPYPPCNAPNVSLSNIKVNGLTISWAPVNTAVGYQYAIDTSATPPTGGTNTTNTTETIAGLIDESAYYLHIRTNCGPGGFSPWLSIPFATAAYCTAPTAIFSNITESRADINWNAMNGAVSYEYAVSTNIVPPVSGAVTTGLNHNADQLQPFTQYYVHLRSTCDNDISNWSTSGFITLAPVSVNNVSGESGITVYPNPVKDVLNVKIKETQVGGQLLLADVTGKIIAGYQVQDVAQQLDMSQMAAGVYMLKYTYDGNVSITRIIKE